MCRSNMRRQMLSLGLFKITIVIFLFLNGSEGVSGVPVKSCQAAQFLCNTGICIPLIWKCDGDEDCTDGSDEGDCHNITCSGFRCNDGLCIPLTWRCDRELDCKDGSDEAIDVCGNVSCKQDEFRCLSNICIDVKLLCDGRNDCGDRSDENCTPVPCGPLEFHCNVSGTCLSTSQLCDGVVHCPDGSDEMNEKCLPGNPSSTTCLFSEFQCGPAECIPNTWVCDGHPDCEDGQDERGCGETPFLLFADGRGIGSLDAMGKPIMVTAIKNVGALTADISSLQVFWTNTVQHAVFRNSLDQKLGTAQALAHAQRPAGIAVDWLYRNVYWSDISAHTLNMALMDGTNKRTLFRDDISSPFAVAVDPFSGYIFWSDVGASAKIEKAAMNGVRRIALVTTDIHKPVALALDYAEGHLYWTDSKLRRISRIDFDGNQRKTVVLSKEFLTAPFGLAVFQGFVFWSDKHTGAIYRSSKMDGSNLTVFASDLQNPHGLMIFHAEVQPYGKNVCATTGISCDFLCVPEPANDTASPFRYSCLCPDIAANDSSLRCGSHPGNDSSETRVVKKSQNKNTLFYWIFGLSVLFSIVVCCFVLWWRTEVHRHKKRMFSLATMKVSQECLMSEKRLNAPLSFSTEDEEGQTLQSSTPSLLTCSSSHRR